MPKNKQLDEKTFFQGEDNFYSISRILLFPPVYDTDIGTEADDFIDARLSEGEAGTTLTSIYGAGGNDTVLADQTLFETYHINVFGGAGFDTLSYERFNRGVFATITSGALEQLGRENIDPIYINLEGKNYIDVERVFGTNFGDVIVGDSGDNIIAGGRGDDFLFGNFGYDILNGQGGNDTMWAGGIGTSTVYGGNGTNTLFLLEGQSTDPTKTGADIVLTTAGSGLAGYHNINSLVIFQQIQIINGTPGADNFYAGGDNYTVYGGGGNDTYFGSAGIDIVRGGSDDDRLRGAGGDDYLYGDFGSDILTGGRGRDVLWGGTGNDTFVLTGVDAADVIADFNFGASTYKDKIDVRGILGSVTNWSSTTDIHNYLRIIVDGTTGLDTLQVFVDRGTTSSGWTNIAGFEAAQPNTSLGLNFDLLLNANQFILT